LGTSPGDRIPFAYGTLTLCGLSFHNSSARHRFCNSLERLLPFQASPTTPLQHRQQAVPLQRFGLLPFRSPLLRKSQLLSFPRGTEMFQFPRFPPLGLCVQPRVTGHDPCRVSPFGDPRIEAWSAAPRGLSQPPTSFIGIWRQGIHRWLFVAWNLQDARARYAVLKKRSNPFVGFQSNGRPEGADRRLTEKDRGQILDDLKPRSFKTE
jgi:hypothetical protein